MGRTTPRPQRLALIKQLGLDQPFFVQYGHFLWNSLHGNFGISYRLAQPVGSLIAERLPATLELAITASVLAFAIGVPMGVYTGIHRNTLLSRLFMVGSLVGVSLPTFLLGVLLILTFSVALGWLPSFGRGPVVHVGGWWTTGLTSWAGIRSLILPAVTLGLYQMTLIMRLVRAEMLEVLRTDYIKFARARGLTNRTVNFGHALKNTLVPVITIIGLQFGGIVAFSLVTENGVPMAGNGAAAGAVRLGRRHSRDVGLSDANRAGLRADQFAGRSAVLRCRSAPEDKPLMSDTSLVSRAWNSDMGYSFRTSPVALVSALIALILIVAAMFAPLIAPHDPMDVASLSLMDSFKPPVGMADADWSNVLGTDNQGRDVLSAIMYGMRISLLVGFLSTLFAIVVGVGVGMLAGYPGGVVDAVLMRVADVQLTFPSILTALLVDGVITAALPGTMRAALQIYVIIFAIGISLWPNFARTVRGSTMVERNKDYVMAAKVIGVPSWRIMLHHVLPNVIGPVMVIATLGLGQAIIAEATLSFLGVGLPSTQPSLGTLIRFGDDFLFSGQWWVTVFPGVALILMVLAINLLGDWLRDALNPRLR